MTFRYLAFAALVTSGLAACAGDQTLIASHDINRAYDEHQVGFATRDGRSIPVVIAGTPFNTSRAALDAAVTMAMNGSNFGPAVTFAVDPAKPATQNSRVVMAFNPEGIPLSGSLCLAVPQSRPASGVDLRVVAAYCQGSQPMTEATGSIGNVNGPDSPNFRALTVQLTQALFPPRNPHRDESYDTCSNC
jgi:hypothetical protein